MRKTQTNHHRGFIFELDSVPLGGRWGAGAGGRRRERRPRWNIQYGTLTSRVVISYLWYSLPLDTQPLKCIEF